MRLLVLGAAGMLGHKLHQGFLARGLDTWGTTRGPARAVARPGLFGADRLIDGVLAQDFDSVIAAVARCRPQVIVNAIGLVKQLPAASDPIAALEVNSLFPHRLAALSGATGARLIHISTDCVFSGRTGNYTERDTPDADDLYGRSKQLGETTAPGALTLRTSIIGRELGSSHGLLEWFLAQRGGRVKGYRRAIFSGLTTAALTDVLACLIEAHPGLTGLWHVAAEPIDKLALLTRLRDAYRCSIEIVPDDALAIDRSLSAAGLRAATGWVPPTWPEMIERLAADPTPYDAGHAS